MMPPDTVVCLATYYDVFRLLESPTGKTAEADRHLAQDCARHARMFFNTPDFDLDEAAAGTFSLAPSYTVERRS
ncbi:MAG: hypothetical protein ABR606_02030 [Vicinamibacterales bacterium]